MPMNFVTGIAVGVLAVWAFHKFVAPLPGGSARRGG